MEFYLDAIPENLLIHIFSKLNLKSTLKVKHFYDHYHDDNLEDREKLFKDVIGLMYPFFWGLYNQSYSKEITPLPWNNFILYTNLLKVKETFGKDYFLLTGIVSGECNQESISRRFVRDIIYINKTLSELFIMRTAVYYYSKIKEFGLLEIILLSGDDVYGISKMLVNIECGTIWNTSLNNKIRSYIESGQRLSPDDLAKFSDFGNSLDPSSSPYDTFWTYLCPIILLDTNPPEVPLNLINSCISHNHWSERTDILDLLRSVPEYNTLVSEFVDSVDSMESDYDD